MFNIILRFFSELKTPELKCSRVGHKERFREQRIRRYSDSRSYVVVDTVESQTVCSRCKNLIGEPEIISKTGIHSCSMPSHMWDELDSEGKLILS